MNYVSAGSITANWRVRIEIAGVSVGDEFPIWGGMLEADTDLRTASSFVLTTTVAVSRNADSLLFTASDFFDNEAIRGTACLWFAPNFSSALKITWAAR